MTIAIHGLGRMGMQISRKLSEANHLVIAHNRSFEKSEEAARFGAKPAATKEDVVKLFDTEPVIIWIMLPAEIVDQQIDEWFELLPKGSILIDGGNSDFRLTKELSARVEAKGFKLVDVGVSGGVWGYQNGFSMMAGANDRQAFEVIEPALIDLAKPEGGYAYFGESGSGHFVKMVHNAIEYGMMESLAEGYRFLKDGPYGNLDLAAAGEVWQHHSVITSWLNQLCRDALKENPTLEGINGYVAENGEARWTLEVANSMNIGMPSIESALDVRLASQKGEINFSTQLLAAMRNLFGGHALNKDD